MTRDSDGTAKRRNAKALRSPSGLPSASLKGIARYFIQWRACRKLNKLVQQAKEQRELALKGRDQRGRFVRRVSQ